MRSTMTRLMPSQRGAISLVKHNQEVKDTRSTKKGLLTRLINQAKKRVGYGLNRNAGEINFSEYECAAHVRRTCSNTVKSIDV